MPRLRVSVATAVVLLPLVSGLSASSIRSGGISGYSGSPPTGGQICTSCHGGGSAPTVTLTGPKLVQPGQTNSYTFTVSGGQAIAGGLDVAVSSGALAATDAGTRLLNSEITHNAARMADINGDVIFTFDWTAPASGFTRMYAAGNSVNMNGSTSGDNAAATTLDIAIMSGGCQVDYSTYGAGSPGTGGLVPALSGIDGACTGGYSMQLGNAVGGALAFLWVSDSSASIPYGGGNILVNIGSPLWFVFPPFTLGGASGAAGAGSLSLPGIDVTSLSGLDLFFQFLVLDAGAQKGVALSNGLQMDIG